MKIKYQEINGCNLMTPCPFKKGGNRVVARVGSSYCETKCDNFDIIDKDKKIVFCKGTIKDLLK